MLRRSLVSLNYTKLLRKSSKSFYKWRFFEEDIVPTYLIIPDTPTTDVNHPMTNPINIPNFKNLTPDQVFRGASSLAQFFDEKLEELIEEIESGEAPADIGYVVDAIEKFTYPLDCAQNWSTLKYCLADNILFAMVDAVVRKKARMCRTERWTGKVMKGMIDQLAAKEAGDLTEFDRGILNVYQREFALTGAHLSDMTTQTLMKNRIFEFNLGVNFHHIVEASSRKFKQLVDVNTLSEAPPGFVEGLMLQGDSQGPGKPTRGGGFCEISLDAAVFPTFMTYCSDRSLRRNAWEAWCRRAGQVMHASDFLSNHNNIPEMRKYRRVIAEILGFKNFAELKLSGQMAGKVETVIEMLDLYRLKYFERAEDEVKTLLDYALRDTTSLDVDAPLRPWDVSYYTRKYVNEFPIYDSQRVRQYLPFEHVLNKSFDLFRIWFNIDIVPASGVELPHEDVRYFHVKDLAQEGKVIASFYLDPFTRPGKVNASLTMPVVERSDLFGNNPVAYLLMDIRRHSEQHLMSVGEVGDLMMRLGTGLQHLLTRVDHAEIAGRSQIPPDALDICGHVFERLLRSPAVFRSLTGHCETGEAMPGELVEAVTSRRQPFMALALMEKMYYAAFDLELWISDTFWRDCQSKLWSEFMVLEEVEGNEWPCGFTQIFSGGREAAMYSDVWAQTVAGDIVNAFEDMSLDITSHNITLAEMKPVMERFRATFLGLGGSVPAAEVFRRFRGRDPVRTVELL